MLKISGFGWDDEQKMVPVDSDDVLLNYVRDRATGELVEDPADAVAAMEKEDANATTEEGEQSPVEQFSNTSNRADSTKTGKKGARPVEGIPTELSEMTKNLGSFIENTNTTMVEIAHRIGYSHDLSQQRRLVNEELLKLPMSTTQRLMATSMIVKDEDKVDLFFSLDENDKMEWVSLLLEGLLFLIRIPRDSGIFVDNLGLVEIISVYDLGNGNGVPYTRATLLLSSRGHRATPDSCGTDNTCNGGVETKYLRNLVVASVASAT
ncbi:hypothetical protein HYC85_030767 [Camellia sinensis]|uniref:Uncharacterized protein n=1 Tax=Camellia sinensis TaxID=4442 RepID=A0A7J7G5M9_CAMSI|nr:hypothetical protein HYC85_030767 [Camellia sinensis]